MSSLASIAVAASVLFYAAILLGILRSAYARYQERYVTKAVSDLSEMFLFIDSRQLLMLNACSAVALGVIGFLAINPFASALSAAEIQRSAGGCPASDGECFASRAHLCSGRRACLKRVRGPAFTGIRSSDQ